MKDYRVSFNHTIHAWTSVNAESVEEAKQLIQEQLDAYGLESFVYDLFDREINVVDAEEQAQ